MGPVPTLEIRKVRITNRFLIEIHRNLFRVNEGEMVSRLFLFQLGFQEGHSTATALTKILDDVHLVVEKDGFSKAFDSMSHGLLPHAILSVVSWAAGDKE
jgi:hypothetical protein